VYVGQRIEPGSLSRHGVEALPQSEVVALGPAEPVDGWGADVRVCRSVAVPEVGPLCQVLPLGPVVVLAHAAGPLLFSAT
jgi:hypothetical protein